MTRKTDTGLALRCVACRTPLLARHDLEWVAREWSRDDWDTRPSRPAGALADAHDGALACPSADCGRVFFLWDGIANLLAGEAGIPPRGGC